MTAAADTIATEVLPHGLRRYWRGCTCTLCKAGMAAYKRNRHRQIAYGRWQPLVSAEPARLHVRSLMAQGLGWQRIAHLAGVKTATVNRLLYGERCNGKAPSVMIRARSAELLLAVRATLDVFADETRVDATGCRRRLRACASLGWTNRALAARLGVSPRTMTLVLAGQDYVHARFVRDTIELCKTIGYTPPTAGNVREAQAITRARNSARHKGWVSLLAWNDIDDPAEMPVVDAPTLRSPDDVVVLELIAGRRRVKARPEDRREAARRLLAHGAGLHVVSRQVGLSWKAIQQLMEEQGRSDVAA